MHIWVVWQWRALCFVVTRTWRPPLALALVIAYGITMMALFSFVLFETYLKASFTVQIIVIVAVRIVAYLFSLVLHAVMSTSWRDVESRNRSMRGNYILHAFSVSFSSTIGRTMTTLTLANSPTGLVFFELLGLVVEVSLYCTTFMLSLRNIYGKIRNFCSKQKQLPSEEDEKKRIEFTIEHKFKMQLIKLSLDITSVVQTPNWWICLSYLYLQANWCQTTSCSSSQRIYALQVWYIPYAWTAATFSANMHSAVYVLVLPGVIALYK